MPHPSTESAQRQSAALRIWRRLPAIASFVLLAWQLALPWTAPHFVTNDGPSHLYGATVARDLLFHHRQSPYSPVYTIQRAAVPNWTSTLVLAATGVIAGTDHAEALFASLAIAIGFFGLSYMKRALAPDESPWTPLSNFLVQTWFLWIGFYNFYLSMVLMPFVIGYHLRHSGSSVYAECPVERVEGRLTASRLVILAAGLTALFFTHVIALAIALLAMGTVAVWRCVLIPAVKARRLLRLASWREPALLILAAAPSLILTGIYMYAHRQAGMSVGSGEPLRNLFLTFPRQLYVTGMSTWGKQNLLWKIVLGYMLAASALMKKKEWASPRGGVVIATILCFLAYFFVPDEGFGGNTVIVRFAWGVFILGGVATATTARLRIMAVPFALCVTALLSANLADTGHTARKISYAVDSYLQTARAVPAGSTLVRLNYPAPAGPVRYGYEESGRAPFFHLDALVASEKHVLDLTDYEQHTRLFPVVQKKAFLGQEYQLWGFESAGPDDLGLLKWVREVFPKPIDYVFLFGEEQSEEARKAGMPAMAAYLNSNLRLLATSGDGLLRLYTRR